MSSELQARYAATSRRRTYLVGGLVLAVSTSLALMAVEVALRVFDLAPSSGVVTVTQQEFERVPGIFTPGQRLVDRTISALPHRVSINSLGYRGEELPPAKPEGEIRVLIVGDSMTFGSFVDDEDTLPAGVEQHLNQRCSRVRVINAGVPGSSIVTQAAMVERALPLRPDLVVLLFSANDLDDLRAPLWDSLATNRELKSRFPLSLVYPLLRDTAIWQLMLKVRGAMRAASSSTPESGGGADAPIRLEEQNAPMKAMYSERLAALYRTLSERRLPMVFAVYPFHQSVTARALSEAEAWGLNAARELGIATVDLLPPLLSSGLSTQELYLLPHDGHPRATGHLIAASYLAEVIGAQPPIAPLCTAAVGGR